MREVIDIKKPTSFICHFVWQEGDPSMPYYQCAFDPNDPGVFSPSGDFIRFQVGDSEIHGWVRKDMIVIDEILEENEVAEAVNG